MNRPSRLGLLVAMVAVLLVADPALASAREPLRGTADVQEAVTLLRDAARAGAHVSYSGTQFVTVWSEGGGTSAVLASVRHTPGGGTSYRVLGGQDPGSTVVDDLGDERLVDLMVAAYDVQVAGSGTVAGRSAHVVDLRRSDGTLAARVWTDTETCLLLRREVYDESGTLVRAGGFLDLDVRATEDAAAGRSGSAYVPTTASGRPSARRTPSLPAGPDLPTRLGDALVLHDASRSRMGSATVTHLLYTDGLSSVSLFYQRGRLDADDLEGFSAHQVGGTTVHVADTPPMRVTWDCYGYVYTMVADASSTSLQAMLAVLPHTDDEDDPGFRDRVTRGLDRVGGWLNPFG